MLLPQIGAAGQERLSAGRVLLVGCGALGTVLADQLVRAGVGLLRIVDRDIVEMSNLHRQVLFDEADARDELPKAVAAARRLGRINSAVRVASLVADVHAGNIEELADPANTDLILDGTDNAETRYLINDWSVKTSLPWVYGACVGTEGRAMAIRPGRTPCLRCIFPDPPGPGELATCDTAGVLGPAAAVVASLQATMAIKLLSGNESALRDELVQTDLWTGRWHATDLTDARRPDCVCCGQGRFEFLDAVGGGAATSLCGREAVQIRPSGQGSIDLAQLAKRLAEVGQVQSTAFFIRCALADPRGIGLTVFPDGRVIVAGTSDQARARSLAARFVGL